MALTKCKECKHEISKEAKICPNCGAKNKSETDFMPLFIIALAILMFAYLLQTPATNNTTRASSITVEPAAEPEKPNWSTFESKDEMSGSTTHYATSPRTKPNSPMGFPYADVTAVIGVGCDKTSKWAYFRFSKAPNLTNTDTEDGYNIIKNRIKWGDKLDTITLTQVWGSDALHAKYKPDFISKLMANKSVVLELDWHGQSRVLFDFPLNQSSESLEKIFKSCGM